MQTDYITKSIWFVLQMAKLTKISEFKLDVKANKSKTVYIIRYEYLLKKHK